MQRVALLWGYRVRVLRVRGKTHISIYCVARSDAWIWRTVDLNVDWLSRVFAVD